MSTPNHHSCCPLCKDKVAKLQQMVNLLFCYMSDFLPEPTQAPAARVSLSTDSRTQKTYETPMSAHGTVGRRTEGVSQAGSRSKSAVRQGSSYQSDKEGIERDEQSHTIQDDNLHESFA